MARLADYFIVVGYDQEKAGKFGSQIELAELRFMSRPSVSVCVMMLMLDSIALA